MRRIPKNAKKALFKNIISSLIIKGRVETTETRAKAVRRLVDKLISRAREKTLASRRQIMAFFNDKKVVGKLVDEIIPKLGQRVSGFTRVLKIKKRVGDRATVARLELITEVGEEKPPKETEVKKEKIEKKSVKRVKKNKKGEK